MRRILAWFLLCLLCGILTYPVADFLLWEMRGRFLPTYRDTRILCERRSLKALSETAETSPLVALEHEPAFLNSKECVQLLQLLADYRSSLHWRSLFLSVVVFLATIIVRFVMFPPTLRPKSG